MVPGFRRDDVWTPAFAGVTALVTFYDFVKDLWLVFKQVPDPLNLGSSPTNPEMIRAL
jgi:hypothetical protein